MPRETHYADDVVLDAALAVVRQKGYEALSARAVAEQAGCSVQPIYHRFGGMNGLTKALYEHARAWVQNYNHMHAHACSNKFASNGAAHITLAKEEPELFRFLYVSPHLAATSMKELFKSVSQPGVIEEIKQLKNLDQEEASYLYEQMIVFTHGLACMALAGSLFADEEINCLVNDAFRAFYRDITHAKCESTDTANKESH